MPIMYRLSKNNNMSSKAYGKSYASAVMMGTVSTDELILRVHERSGMRKSVLMGAIIELTTEIREQLLMSKRVNLEGFGSFKVGIEGSKLHVIFQPESKLDICTQRRKTFLTDAKLQEVR